MILKKTIDQLRRLDAPLDKIYLMLALLEGKVDDSPFFYGLDDQSRILSLFTIASFYQKKFVEELLEDYEADVFFNYLSAQQEFKFEPGHVLQIYNEIKQKGEEHYGFSRFDGVDQDRPESQISGDAC